jgi:hypothetical protein
MYGNLLKTRQIEIEKARDSQPHTSKKSPAAEAAGPNLITITKRSGRTQKTKRAINWPDRGAST